MTDDIKRLATMLTRAFHEGFNFTREGWNGECAFDHLAPDGLTLEEKSAITVREILADHDAKPAASGNAVTLTDAEREAIEWCLSLPILHCDVVRMMPLRSLLERLK